MATVLSVIQRVSRVIGVSEPAAIYAGSSREQVELGETANIAAEMILQAHDWRELMTLQTEAGDGSTEDFDLPSDYDRMPKAQRLWSTEIETPLTHVKDIDKWLDLDIRSYQFVVGVWIKFGGQLHIKPAPSSGASVKYYYVSNLIVAPAAGSNKTAFDADTDTFRLSDKLLRLCMVWLWKANKGLPYSEDLASYEDALSEEISADKGARVLAIGSPKMPRDIDISYPKAINT